MTALATTMTIDEFLALPEEPGVSRWLIDGVLHEERGEHVTRRSRIHSYAESRLTQMLLNWLDTQPEPRGEVHSGEIGFILDRDAGISVGVDVAYIDAETATRQSQCETTLIEGVPVLAAEVLSPSDKQEDIDDKVEAYLRVGVRHIWLANPRLRTLTIFRPDQPAAIQEPDASVTAEPEMPGLRVPLTDIFL